MWKSAPFGGVIVINLLGIIHMTDRRNTPENTANDTIQSPFPRYSPKMPEWRKILLFSRILRISGSLPPRIRQMPQKPLFRGFSGAFRAFWGKSAALASNDLKLPLKCGKTALHRGFPRHLQAILPLNTDKASNKRRIAQITPSAYCYA